MKNKNDWDFPDVEGDFSLVDDLEILDTGDFELVDIDQERESTDEGNDFESIFEEDESVSGEVIEPSTLVDQNLMTEEEPEVKEEAEESVEEASTSEEAAEIEVEEEVSEESVVLEAKEEPTSEESSEEVYEEAIEATSEEVVSEEEEASLEIEEIAEEVKTEERGEGEMVERFKVEELNSVLKSLLDVSPDFQGSALVSTDGFVIASVLQEGTSEEKVGAMSAAILSLGERAASELNKGKLNTVFVEGEDGYAIITNVTDNVLLLLSTTKYAKLGLVFYELSAVKSALKEHFEK